MICQNDNRPCEKPFCRAEGCIIKHIDQAQSYKRLDEYINLLNKESKPPNKQPNEHTKQNTNPCKHR
jgi:hypothetical protein